MGRLVERRQKPARGAADLSGRKTESAVKEWGERVAKYIPAEILTFYTAAVSLIGAYDPIAQGGKRLWLFGIVGFIFWLLTPFWLGRFSKDKSVRITNQIIGFLAFGIWAYAFPSGWFKDMGLYDPILAGVLLILFAAVSGFITPK
jgi:hypothetical protein